MIEWILHQQTHNMIETDKTRLNRWTFVTTSLLIKDCTILCCRTGERHISDKSMNEQCPMSNEVPQVCLGVNSEFCPREFLITQIKMEIRNAQAVSLIFSTLFLV